jgi:hypothetical protein
MQGSRVDVQRAVATARTQRLNLKQFTFSVNPARGCSEACRGSFPPALRQNRDPVNRLTCESAVLPYFAGMKSQSLLAGLLLAACLESGADHG